MDPETLTPSSPADRYVVRACANPKVLAAVMNSAPRTWRIHLVEKLGDEWVVIFEIQ